MQKEKPTKVYKSSKDNQPEKKGSEAFEKIVKNAKRIVDKAMAGSIKHIAILVAAGLFTVAVVGGAVWGISGIVGGNSQGNNVNEIEIDPEADNKYDKDANLIDTSKYASTILQETADAGQEYIDGTLFVGDSNTVRSLMYEVTGTTWENVVGAVGIGIQHVASDPFACVTFTQPEDPVDIVTAIKWIQPKRVVFTFGTNNASWTVESFIEEYKKAIDAAYEVYPYFDVIVNAIPPVHKIRDYPNVTMQQIDAFNAALAQMCEEEGYKFLNSAEVLKDETTGFAKEAYTISDGIHLSKEGFTALFEYIRTHAYETEDRRPELTYCPKRNEIEMPTIVQDPVAIRGGVKVIFTSNDYELGSVSGEVEQYVKYTKTSDTVTAVAKSENGGIFTGWSCEYGGISDTGSSTITFTAPMLDESITEIRVTANFKKGDVDISNNSLSLTVGKTATLSAHASGGHSIKWSSSNTKIATVDGNGKVTAVAPGTAKIIASALDGAMSASCTVTVQAAATPTPAILESISIKAKDDAKEVKVGSTLELTAVANPENAVLSTVTWTSSDTSIATVTTNGATTGVKGVKAGKVTITASVNDGKLKDTYEVTVVSSEKPLTGITVSAEPTTIEVGKTTTVKATKAPADTTDTTAVEFTSSNTSVATVDKTTGVVTGKAKGTTEITAKCGSYSDKITITVKEATATATSTPTATPTTAPTATPTATPTTAPTATPTASPTTAPTPHTHSGGTATCTAQAVCGTCGQSYGELAGHTPGEAATCGKAQTCTVCGTTLAAATGAHSGGTATCTAQAVCGTCGQSYGDLASHTMVDDGNGGQKCSVCG